LLILHTAANSAHAGHGQFCAKFCMGRILTSLVRTVLEAFCVVAVYALLAWVHTWSCAESLLTQYLVNCLRELHQVDRFGAAGCKDELIRFWGQRVEGQVTARPQM